MTTSLISVSTQAGIRTIELVRPAKRNALSTELLTQLGQAVDDTRGAAPDVRVVLLRGSGGHFCAGADINEFTTWDPAGLAAFIELGSRVFAAVAELPQPVIALVEGVALGGGLELALTCDQRVAESDAVLGFPEVGLGAVPGWGGTVRLQELVGRSTATRIVLGAERLPAQRALEIGLVDESVAPGEGLQAALALARGWAAQSPAALQSAVRAVRRASPFAPDQQVDLELYVNLLCMASPERRVAVTAFLDRTPQPQPPNPAS